MFNVLLTKHAEKELKTLNKQISTRISKAFDELSTTGTKSSNVKKLQTPFPGYRKRVGDYRILFETNAEIIVIYKITKRSEVYR